MSIGGGSKIVINNEFHWNNANHGINNNPTVELGPNAKFFRLGNVPGLDVFNHLQRRHRPHSRRQRFGYNGRDGHLEPQHHEQRSI